MFKYFFLFRLAMIQSLKNIQSVIGLNLFLLTCLFVFAHLWKVAALKVGALHLRPDQLLWYIALNEWVLISIPDIQVDMEQDLRSGKLATLLPRPISYLGSIFSEGCGKLMVNLMTLGPVSFLFARWQLGTCPCHLGSFAMWLLLGVLAGVLGVLFQMLVGISAFWLKEVSPFNWIWEKLLFVFGGLILPLSVYPLWLQKMAHWTPFPIILGQRSALAIHFSWTEVTQMFASLFLWGLIAVGTLTLLYRRGLKILNIEGG
jgi:ABC-2 type transport system permease protein